MIKVPLDKEILKRMGFYESLVGLVELRATCRPDRKAAAILINKNYRVVSMGYNGSPPGVPHCNKTGCIMFEGHCIGTLHAEMNALANLEAISPDLTMICSMKPCLSCLKLLLGFKVKTIIYLRDYQDKARDTFVKAINKNAGFSTEEKFRFGEYYLTDLNFLLHKGTIMVKYISKMSEL